MHELRRGVALAALTVACVLGAPPQRVAAVAERIAVVQVATDRRRTRWRRSDRLPAARRRGSWHPANRTR